MWSRRPRGVEMNPSGTIVVGVDGSPESGAAIEFAMREAMRRGAAVTRGGHRRHQADRPGDARRGRQRASRAGRRRVQPRGHRRTARAGARRGIRGRRPARAGPPRPRSAAQRPARIRRTALRPARNLPGHRRPARRRHRADARRGAGLRSTAMRHTTVADVMSTNVISARPQDSFAHLTTLLRGAAIRAVPVVDDDGTLLGVVSEADLMAAVARPDGYEARRWWRPRHVRRQAPGSKAGATTAAELMTTGVETVTPATRVS